MQGLLSVLGLCLAVSAHADDEDPPVLQPAGRVQLDYNRAVDVPMPEAGAGFDVRRARVQLTLQPHDAFRAKLDWNLERMIVHDLYADLGPQRAQLRVGQTKEPLSSTFMESSLHLPFAERPMLHDVLGSDRLVGGVLRMRPGPVFIQLAAGARKPFSQGSGGTEGVGRAAWEIVDGAVLSAGGATGAYEAFEVRGITVTGRAWTPTSTPTRSGLLHRGTVGFRFVTSPVRIDVEALGVAAGNGDMPLSIGGAYADVLVMLTGERHTPDGRLEPRRSILDGGPGAWELGIRSEHIRARGALEADIHALTGGFTWYLFEHVKLPANVVHTWLPDDDELAVVLRLQVEA